MLFRSKTAVINHMQDKGHVKIRFDEIGQAELAAYYNYEREAPLVNASEIMEDDGDEEYMDISEDDEIQTATESTVWVTPDETELILPLELVSVIELIDGTTSKTCCHTLARILSGTCRNSPP